MIRFEEITNKNIWKVCSLEPFEEQKDFVAENIQSLAEAYATRNEGNNALPLAVYDDEDLIGFLMIGKGTVGNEDESDLIKENYSIWRLMIDKKYQGRGFGKQTLDAAIALIRTFPFGEAEKVWLSYEPENVRARDIYMKFGFKENGEMCGNEIVAVYELRGPGIGESHIIFKDGNGWRACFDEEKGRYFGEYGGGMSYNLYELTKEMYDLLREEMTEGDASSIMYDGRHLYMSVCDRCGPPYTVVFDDECRELCPWAKFIGSGRVWPDELTDAAVEIFESEANNREQRRKKRKEREEKKETE